MVRATVITKAACLEGNIGGVRVTKAEIGDQQLRIQTQLKTADALTQIGNRYKEFGLKDKANEKYDQALAVCDDVADEARNSAEPFSNKPTSAVEHLLRDGQARPGAAMCQRLQNEFRAVASLTTRCLQLGDVAKKSGDLQRAISIYSRLEAMKTSQLRAKPSSALQSATRRWRKRRRIKPLWPKWKTGLSGVQEGLRPVPRKRSRG
jgi:tetratricopeptide (TPR) repeat protein